MNQDWHGKSPDTKRDRLEAELARAQAELDA